MQVAIDFLYSFKSLLKFNKIQIDNNIFKLHYKFTVLLLMAFSLLITTKQYFGEPIDCDVQSEFKSIINTYCWIYGTFTIKSTLVEKNLPGLGNHLSQQNGGENNDTVFWQKYYQWVCLMLILQAMMFYIPRYVWKVWEAGRLHALVGDLCGPLVPSSWNRQCKIKLINYILSEKYSHNLYCIRFTVCETLNLVNVVLQILLLNSFLGDSFLEFGMALFTFDNINPMTSTFPKLTKCTYFRYGVSGTREIRDALCILPLNIVNEKLFLVVWFWFLILSILSVLELIHQFAFLCVPRFRIYLLMAQAHYLPRSDAEAIVKRLSFGDYFLLRQMGKNLNILVFKEYVGGIANALKKTSRDYNLEIDSLV